MVNLTSKRYKILRPKTTTKNAIWGLVILILGLILTGIATYYAQNEVDAEAKREFASTCNEIKIKTANRLRTTAQLLLTGSAFFEASDSVSRGAWKKFIERSKYELNLPGIKGLGYSIIIPENQIQQHIQKIRREGFAGYDVKPSGNRDVFTSIIYLEPFSGANLRAFGYDMYSDSTRRSAMEVSRDSDSVTLTGKVTLVQNSPEDQRKGILMYSPVYSKGLEVKTLWQRRLAIKGWVYSPFYLNDLMLGILGRWESEQKNRIRLQIYNQDISNHSLLYDSQGNGALIDNNSPSRTLSLKVSPYNIKWILLFTQPIRQTPFFQNLVKVVAVSGILISLLIFLLSVSLFNTRFRAQQIAGNLTLKHKESEERIREVLENSQDASYKLNLLTNKYDYLSPVFERITGYTPYEMDTFPLETVKGLIHQDDIPKTDHLRTMALSDHSRKVNQIDYRFRQKNGQYLWLQDRFNVLWDDHNRPIALIGSVSNISERKKFEDALMEEKLLLRTIIDNIPDSIYCMDLACRKTLANLTDLWYMGAKTEGEVIGKDDFAFYPIELAREFFALDQAVMQSGKAVFNVEESLIDLGGVKHWLLSSKIPMCNKDGQVIGLLGIGRDITDRKLAEEEIKRKNEELQRLNESKDKFFSIIAHDLRSPFNGFLGLTQIMAEESDTLTPDELQKMAVSMRDAATNLYRLLENLLQWSSMQQNRILFHPEVIHLNPIIADSLAMVLQSAQTKKIEILCMISGDLDVFADSNMLQTILRNLFSNSVKFTGRGGKITISAIKSKDNFIEISVKDTGIGMNSAMIDNLFTVGVSSSRKGTEGEASTGLGLIICKDFVEKHGGQLWATSQEGKGSTFYFTIPGKDI